MEMDKYVNLDHWIGGGFVIIFIFLVVFVYFVRWVFEIPLLIRKVNELGRVLEQIRDELKRK